MSEKRDFKFKVGDQVVITKAHKSSWPVDKELKNPIYTITGRGYRLTKHPQYRIAGLNVEDYFPNNEHYGFAEFWFELHATNNLNLAPWDR